MSNGEPGAASDRPPFYPELEAARGVAALIVVFFHVFVTLEPKWAVFQTHGTVAAVSNIVLTGLFNGAGAVTFFFVLSGFVLGLSLNRIHVLTADRYAEFLLRRLFRILPAVWASLLLALFLIWLFFAGTYERKEILDFFLLRDTRINGPLWSIKIELFASFFYPFLLLASRSVGILFNIGGLLLLISLGIDETPFVFRYMAAFHLGILIPLLGKPTIERMSPVAARVIFFVGVMVFVSAVQFSRFDYLNPKRAIMLEALCSFYFVSFILYAQSRTMTRLLNSAPLRWLGRISFGLYVFHFPIHSLAFGKMNEIWGSRIVEWYPLPQILALPFIVSVSMLTAWIGYHLVEKPFMRWGRIAARRAGDVVRGISRGEALSMGVAGVPSVALLALAAALAYVVYQAALNL